MDVVGDPWRFRDFPDILTQAEEAETVRLVASSFRDERASSKPTQFDLECSSCTAVRMETMR